MTKTIFNPKIHHRRSIRLKEYDYSQPGAYFITICTSKKEYLLGKFNDDTIHLNEIGKMVKKIWNELEERFPNIETDEFVMMPNHIHGIIFINAVVGAAPALFLIPQIKTGTRRGAPIHYFCLMLFKGLNPTPPRNTVLIFRGSINIHLQGNYGTAIITNTSFVMKKI